MSLDNTFNTPQQSQLGRASAYVDRYDAGLLFPIPRALQREAMGIAQHPLPFFGADLWTAFELSWLNPRGKPQLAIAHFTIPCETPNIIESKSLKLYLNSFNSTVFSNAEAVRERLRADLGEAVWRGAERPSTVGVRLMAPDLFDKEQIRELEGVDLDRLDIECTHYQPTPELLLSDTTQTPVSETLTSRLLKSNCLVTGQPDWGSVQIRYSGPQIDQAGLLAYIVSFRNHNEFHEPCAERMFRDIWERCKPNKLAVYARYTRRGGLDISPFRTSWPQALPSNVRTARQ
ncbi:NADPH-dependent 7-cyano-7-deazaguanine reductase QueF [Variovorax defluvii]|uniref:NADPH-dependent 7-cyano-7-deazaguanine reductase n=1 Tax=Variovorax defluvii TaxID=913761 RepID=A0ABP8HWR1_9BURK